MKPPNIGVCFLLESFYPVIHGATTQIMLLGERLANSGVPATVVTRQIKPEHPSYERLKHIDIIRVKPAIGLKPIGKYLMLAPAFFALVKEAKRYNLIIVCDLKVLGILGVIASKILGKKCLLRAESCGEMDGSYATQFGPPASGLRLLLIKALVRLRNSLLVKSDGFLTISSVITKELLEAGVPYKSLIEITNGINTGHFTPVDQETKQLLKNKLGLSDKKHILYTGRLTRGKGLTSLLRVWKRLISEFEDIHLLLIGSGQGHSLSCEDMLKHFVIENQLASSVTFTGNVNNVNEYLQAADLFILPSETESLGLSLIEALACELPCIATSVGGILDIIEDNINGILVPYEDEQKLFEAIKALLENKEKSLRLGREGRKTILTKFNIDQIAERYLSLFRSLYTQRHK